MSSTPRRDACVVFMLLVLVGATRSVADESPRIWLLHLPGMGGEMTIDLLLTRGLSDGGIHAELKIYDWTGTDRGIAALTNVRRHDEQSTLVARMIEAHVRDHPDQAITITCHSAGTGIAVWALEKLPDDVKIDNLVMIASALSPDYDLSKALGHVRGRAYAFNSELDKIILSAGTKVFGTVDRVKTDAAGLVGFKVPDGADSEQYAKLCQFAYDADWMRFQNNGEHIGAMMRPFAKNVIARVLMGRGVPPRATTAPATQPVGHVTTAPTR